MCSLRNRDHQIHNISSLLKLKIVAVSFTCDETDVFPLVYIMEDFFHFDIRVIESGTLCADQETMQALEF